MVNLFQRNSLLTKKYLPKNTFQRYSNPKENSTTKKNTEQAQNTVKKLSLFLIKMTFKKFVNVDS